MAEAEQVSYLCRRTCRTDCTQERSSNALLRAARLLFGRFHRFPPSRVLTERCDRTVPRVLVRLGKLKALVYSSDRGRRGRPRSFIHFMESPPTLACDAPGRRLFIVGGKYRVTPFGIEG